MSGPQTKGQNMAGGSMATQQTARAAACQAVGFIEHCWEHGCGPGRPHFFLRVLAAALPPPPAAPLPAAALSLLLLRALS